MHPQPHQLEITIPLPPQATRANKRHVHWSQKSTAVRKQRQDAGFAALHALQQAGMKAPMWERAIVRATFYNASPKANIADEDNLTYWLKASIDGFADAKIFANDRGVTWEPPKQYIRGSAGGQTKVVITITETEA